MDDAIFNSFPKYGDDFLPSYDCREGCTMRVYNNATAKGFCNYINLLESDGFNTVQRTENNGNLFAAMKRDICVFVYFTPCNAQMRVSACKNDNMPPLAPCESTDGNVTFYAFESDHTIIDCGMCLMIQCGDGSFFIIDSGHYFQFNDNDRIYKFMRERTPLGQKVTVCGWLITHAHTDHIAKLIDFLKYNTDDVVIEGFYQNLLPADYEREEDNHEEIEMAQKLFYVLENYPAPVYKLHTGMRFYVHGLTFDVLATHEDIYPDHIDDYNDSSAVVMLTACGSKIFIPGDAAVLAGRKLEERFGNTLKCDVAQIAHHGHTGLSPHCYELLSADTVIFPVTRIMFEQDINRHEANRTAIKLSGASYITGDGTVEVPLPYNKSTVRQMPDETVEDFEKIKRIWKYEYTEEYKAYIYGKFLENGGDENKLLLPTSPGGWIEPK